ncbi:MAG: MucBP domain-containing protein, partial [Clostridia bacterium]|nr:MucBP domain-containing protein [Clostridia bacterium]
MKKLKVIFCLLLLTVVISLNMQVKAAEQLPDNGARISSAQIIQTKTGTGPWDDDDEPGNDSSEDNNIVRSFDQVTWTLENTMTVTDGGEGYNGGTIYFEAKLPNSLNKQTAKWDVDSMAWIKNPQISSDGLTLTGTYELDSAALTVPGKQTLVLVLSIMGAPNGTTFQPTIKTWLNGNAESDYVTTIPNSITVSAAPNYNVMLVRNGNLAKKVTLDYGEGDILGRVYGYSLALQLYNSQQSKGLKGIEYPQGNITMDVDMLLERSEFESEDLEDITDEVTPVLWNYHIAQNTTNGVISGRRMNFGNSYHTYEPALPYGKRTSLRIDSVYNSGNMSMVQDGRTLHVTFNNYDFDGVFPNDAYGYSGKPHVSIKYTSNIGFFSIGYFQVFIPNKEATTMEDRNYYLTLTDTNYKATSVSGTETTTQMITTDDSNRVQHVLYKPGSYSHNLFFNKWDESKLTTEVSQGDGYVFLGQKIYVCTKFAMSITNDDDVYTAEKFVKFDGSAFEPIYMDDGSRYKVSSYGGNMAFNVYYVTKPDGTNWTSQAEMNAANIENMNVYDSIEDIPADKICVGVYYESIEGGYLAVNTGDNNTTKFPLKVRENAEIGKTYGFVQNTRLWVEQLDRSIYNIKGDYSSYPRQTWQWKNQNYIKTEYNEDGTIKSGTHNGGWQWGNTLLVIGADQTIEIDPINKSDESIKVNYDIGKNENVVTYKISPVISTPEVSSITGVTVSVTSTLPNGLTYVPNSCNYGEPEINDLGGGVTELIWYINDCTVGEDILPLTYDAKIYDEAPNGMQYTTKAVVFADPNLLGTTPIEKRTSTTTIQIINLSSHRLYKTVQTPVIERNGDIHFTIAYKNNTDGTIPDFQLLDILPYNGDGRGTSYNGNYTLDRIVVTQYDANGNVIPNSNLRISYTTDESVRNGVTSKDSDLADDWTVLNTENVARQVTAFAIIGEMVEQENLRVDVYLKTNGNKGLDKYENNATAQVYRETEEMVTSNVTAQVIYRSIEGIAWKDLNANGLKDANEPLFKNINVSLTDENGNQVTDVEGIVIPSIMTNDDGYYKFEDLPRGNYLVKVTIPDDTYTLTEKEVGSNPVTNSKFNVTSATTDEITKLNSLDLPELTQSNVNAGFVKKPTKVVVNYLEKGTLTELLPEKTINGRIDDEYSTTNRLDEVNATNGNKYNYDSVEGDISGFMIEDTIYITYYYIKKDTQVKVLHVEEGTDVSDPESVTEVLYETETLTGKVDDEYNTSNKLTEINNTHTEQYDFVRSTTNTSGTMKVETVYVIYEYKKAPAVVKVNHLEQGTGTVLSPQETLNGIVGLGYETSNKLDAINAENANKYELVTPEPSNKNGTYAREEQTVTYYYQKKMAEVEVNYVEVGTNTVLADQENMSDRIDEPYTTVNKLDEINAANGNKYEFVRVDGNATGNYTLDKQVVTYYYQKKMAEVEVNYVELGTDTVLADQENMSDRIDEPYTTVNKLDEINAANGNKYEFVRVDGNATGNY